MKIKKTLASLLVTLLLLGSLNADEGMWAFQNPPLAQWKARYNFEPSTEWLEHARLASVQIGASGAFVSPNGLLLTNQHVAANILAKVSSKEKNYTKDGFYARTQADEIKSPGLEVTVLISYEDVTARVKGAVSKGASDKVAAEQRKAAMADIEKESTHATGLKSDVIKLYNGGEYWLYRQKKYTDVRVVFAVDEQSAFFGGDLDNFTYPRYDLDAAFFRVYEDGKPAHTPHYFKWSKAGPSDGEFVVAIGAPGGTSRLSTIAELQYQRDIGNPLQKQVWEARLKALEAYAATGPEQARQAGSDIRGFNNSLKRLNGQQEGLLNPRLFAKKESEENELRAAISKDKELSKICGLAFVQTKAVFTKLQPYAKRMAFSNLSASTLATIASSLVRYADQMQKPNDKRYEEFRDSHLDSFKFRLYSPAPIYPELEKAVLTAWLSEGLKQLGPNDPFIKAALGEADPAEVVGRAVRETKLADVAMRKALIEGGAQAIAASDDPMLTLARRVEPVIRKLRAFSEDSIASVLTKNGEKIAAARFAVKGHAIAPDANSTQRLSYGRVKGYEEGSTLVPFKTNLYGLYARAYSFDEAPPFELPELWKANASKVDMTTPLNFVYTADTIGGNSGSPVVNRNGELVGLNFDSNRQKLSNKYWYVEEDEGGRAVAVHSAAIMEALQNLYNADALVREITLNSDPSTNRLAPTSPELSLPRPK